MGNKTVTIGAMKVSEALAAKLDDLRRKEKDVPNRSEMIRRLIERAK